MWFLHYRYLMGGRRGSNAPLVGFKPNPVIVRGDSQSGDAIQELIREESSLGSICLASSELTQRLCVMTREAIVGATADGAVIMKPPSQRVWPIASAPPEVMSSLTTRRAIEPLQRRHRGTLNESTNVSVKTGGSRVGGPDLCILG